MGYLLAFPFRPAIAWIFVGLAGLPAPGPDSAALVFGAAGVTLSSGIAGWIEYLLLRAAIARRIGEVRAASGHSARLWGSALAAGAATLAALRFLIRPACGAAGLGDTLQAVLTGAGALAVFAAVYLAAARLSGIEEARRLPGTRWSR
jgi:putative peptidoglycan lipid II flippase